MSKRDYWLEFKTHLSKIQSPSEKMKPFVRALRINYITDIEKLVGLNFNRTVVPVNNPINFRKERAQLSCLQLTNLKIQNLNTGVIYGAH